MKNVTQKSWNGTSQNLKNRCFTIVKHRFPWIPLTHQKSPKWGPLGVILGAFWSQVMHFRGKKMLLKKWWKKESKKRRQSEKRKVRATLGRGCVALKETPEATGQRPETTGQTPWEARYQKPDIQRPQARSQSLHYIRTWTRRQKPMRIPKSQTTWRNLEAQKPRSIEIPEARTLAFQ